jgi:hypothetical protein
MDAIEFGQQEAHKHDNVPFLPELRRQTMDVHQLASSLIPSEKDESFFDSSARKSFYWQNRLDIEREG